MKLDKSEKTRKPARKRFSLRLPKEVYKKVKAYSNFHGLDMNKVIVSVLIGRFGLEHIVIADKSKKSKKELEKEGKRESK